MTSGNGDERQQAAWERVEAKPRCVAEVMNGVDARLTTLGKRLDVVKNAPLNYGKALFQLTMLVTAIDYDLNARFRKLDAIFDHLCDEVCGGCNHGASYLIALQMSMEQQLTALEENLLASHT